jgi:hypothetical protein
MVAPVGFLAETHNLHIRGGGKYFFYLSIPLWLQDPNLRTPNPGFNPGFTPAFVI